MLAAEAEAAAGRTVAVAVAAAAGDEDDDEVELDGEGTLLGCFTKLDEAVDEEEPFDGDGGGNI